MVKIQGIVLDSATRRPPIFPLERAVGRFMLFYAHKAVFAAPVAKTRASEPPTNPFTCIPWHVGRGGYELRPFARRCRPPRRGLAPARGDGHHGPQPVDRRSPGQAPGTAPFGLAAAHACPPGGLGRLL